jgi:hypothetical protein
VAIQYEAAKRLRDELQADYMERHETFRKLRDFWHGRHWQEIESQAHGLAGLFKDLRGQSDVGPDLKIVHNVCKEVVDKYQTYLSPLPQIQVYVDPPRRISVVPPRPVRNGSFTAAGQRTT